MNSRTHMSVISASALRLLAALTLVLTGVLSAGAPLSAQGGDTANMDIGATTCDAGGSCFHEIGAAFTVTTVDGNFIGSCVLTGNRDAQILQSCRVSVPRWTKVVVTEDVSTITQGTMPVENPLSFDTSGNPGAASHWGVQFQNKPQSTTGTTSADAIDIALITRDPKDGHLLTGACYVLVGYSNEGCDENSDGQATFAQIPPDTYTVRQTKTPAGYQTINDYEIKVLPLGNLPNDDVLQIPLGFVVKQAAAQNAPDTLNVSVILIDYTTGETLDTGICVELVGASNVGCDEDLIDGQIDFLDVPAGGPYDLRFSNVPAGWRVGVGAPEPYQLWIMPDPDVPSVLFAFILLDKPDTQVNATNATLLMTFRACPEGFNPATDDYAANCSIPLDAPDAAELLDLRISGAMIANLDRQYDGTYIYTGSSPSATFILSGLDPVARNAFTVVGNDSVDGDQYWINFPNGGTRHVYVYYYYASGAASTSLRPTTSSDSAVLLMTFRGCPEGFNPGTDDFYANCALPLDAPDASFLYHGGDGQGGMNIMWMDRQNDGAYIFQAGQYTMNLQLSGMSPVLRDGYQVFGYDSVDGENYSVNLTPGETREVYVFYYYWP